MRTFYSTAIVSLIMAVAIATAQQPVRPGALARMPVREVSVFKDGHAFVLHEGAMPTDASGNVLMDYLPAPVLGTFWAYSADPAIKVNAGETSPSMWARTEATARPIVGFRLEFSRLLRA